MTTQPTQSRFRIAIYGYLIALSHLTIAPLSSQAQSDLPAGIADVSPSPGATGVSVDTSLTLVFEHATRFEWTSNSFLRIRNLDSGNVVYQIDPESGDSQEGQTTYTVSLPPDTLIPGTTYEATLDYTFARLNIPPWRTYPIDPGIWTFTIESTEASPQPIDIPGIVGLYPEPDSTGHPVGRSLLLRFSTPIAFNHTATASLDILEADTGLIVASLDPTEGDPQSGPDQYEVILPSGTLQPDTRYHVRVAQGFARIQEAPWRTGEIPVGAWQFTTGGIEFNPLSESVQGIRAVYPKPEQNTVRPDLTPHIQFTSPVSFEWTQDRYLAVVDRSTGEVIYEVDPEPIPADGVDSIVAVQLPPGLLRPQQNYALQLDDSFARLQESPWRSGALPTDLWTFSTGAGTPAAVPDFSGVTHVYPAPGAVDLELEPDITLYFDTRCHFDSTEGNQIDIIHKPTGEVVHSLDPDEHDPQNGSFSYTMTVPADVLEPEANYSIQVAARFARFDQAPWWSSTIAANEWEFRTGLGKPSPLPLPIEGITRVYPQPEMVISRSPQTLTVYFSHRISFAETTDRFLRIRNAVTGEALLSVDPDTVDPHEGFRHFSLPLPVELLAENGRYEVTMDYGFARLNTSPWRTGAVNEGIWQFTTGTGEFDNQTPTDPTDPTDPTEPTDPVDPGLPVDDGDSPSQPTAIPPQYGLPADCPCIHEGDGTLYHVGPGQPYENLGDVPWLSLTAGDTVMIEWRDTPYHEKIGIQAQGTATQPVRICGVRGPQGELPIIDGEDATTSPQFQGFFSYWQSNGQSYNDEYLAMIYIKRGSGQPWGVKPRFIEIFNLKVTGAHPDHSFTDAQGNTQSYVNGSAGIRANLVENLTVRATEISGNGNGFFVLSKDSEAEVSRNILFERNFVHSNGIIGDYLEHNIYTQADGITFQYNVIENPTPGMEGSALKDRSVRTVIRYNWIQSGARLLDLVDPEDSFSVIGREADTYVYGNVLINDYDRIPYSTNMIHFGGDTGTTEMYRQNLHFYHNTLVTINATRDRGWRTSYFDLPTAEQTVYIANNIFDRHGDAYLYLMRSGSGNAVLNGVNWFNADWAPAENSEFHPFDGTVIINGTVLAGEGTPLRDVYQYDFRLKQASSVIDVAMPLSVPTEHQATLEYAPHFIGQPRTPLGAGLDLGAWEYRE